MSRKRAAKSLRGTGRPGFDSFEALSSCSPGAPLVWSRERAMKRPVGGAIKRILDILVAGTMLLLAAPLMACVAALVMAADGGPALFAQTRVGFHGRAFRCWKFRTMAIDAEARLAALLAQDPVAALQWERARKLDHDPRITWAGRFLRRASLDELPQLINVLLGDMSCVGPRPVVPQELAKYGFAAPDYLRARPGLTGLWQVRGRSRLSYEDRVALDSEYVARCSLALDLAILARTIPAVMDFDAAG